MTDDLEIPTAIGRFEVTGIVARSATGTVFRAFDPELQRTVAIQGHFQRGR